MKSATTTQLIDSGINLRLPMIFLLIFYDQWGDTRPPEHHATGAYAATTFLPLTPKRQKEWRKLSANLNLFKKQEQSAMRGLPASQIREVSFVNLRNLASS
jgi:hypothetical protein